jgi:hypothetical protein
VKHSRIVVLCLIFLLLTACGGNAPQEVESDVADEGNMLQEVEGGVADEGTVLRLAVAPSDAGVEQGRAVEIRLDNAVDLYGLHVHVEFDPTEMQVKDADPEREDIQIAPGHLPAPDFVALNMVDNEYGMIDYAVVQISPRQPASGSGVVAVIHVQEVSAGASPFTLLHVELADPDGNKLPVQIGDVGVEVSISDLTVIASNYGQQEPVTTWQ